MTKIITKAEPYDEGKPSAYHEAMELGSRNFFYAFDTVWCRPFSILELNSLNFARKSGKIRPYVDAISACTSIDAGQLTPSDFYQIAYWLRLNSYPTRPFTIPWDCRHPEHLALANKPTAGLSDDEMEEVTLAKTSLKNVTPVNSNSVVVNKLDDTQLTRITDHIKAVADKPHGIMLATTTMSDLVEEAELMEQKIRNEKARMNGVEITDIDEVLESIIENQQDELLVELASYIHRSYGETLAERMKYLIALSKDDPSVMGFEFYDDVLEFQRLITHGVDETVTVVCRGCGNATTFNVELDVSDFFPESGTPRPR